MDMVQQQREEEAHRERSALERVGAAIGLEMDDEKDYGDGWKEFRKGAYVINGRCRILLLTLRRVHISDIVCNPCYCTAIAQMRLWLGNMEAQGTCAPARCVYHEAVSLAGDYGGGLSIGR